MKSPILFKVKNDFRSGINLENFRKRMEEAVTNSRKIILDLSEVTYMDTDSSRFVFDYMPNIFILNPPKSEKIIKYYNSWLDSKKGLSKNPKEINIEDIMEDTKSLSIHFF